MVRCCWHSHMEATRESPAPDVRTNIPPNLPPLLLLQPLLPLLLPPQINQIH